MARPLLLFAPGAGAPSTSAWMRAWAERLATVGEVERLDYPYALAGRRSPDKLPVLVAAHRAALAAALARHPGPVVLVGKSMGGRVGCHAALEEPAGAIAGIVCLGYPLRGQRGQFRDEVLLALRVPVLFVQGSRDALCPLEGLEQVRARMAAPTSLHVVEGGNHSLEVGVRALAARGERQADVDAGCWQRWRGSWGASCGRRGRSRGLESGGYGQTRERAADAVTALASLRTACAT